MLLRSLTRVVANHPPSAASGKARNHRTTRAREGAAGQSEPRSAITAANGSAGPDVAHPSARGPLAASAHSCPTVARSGASAPPPSTGHASSEVNATTETAKKAKAIQAPPPLKKRSSVRPGPAVRDVSGSKR